jgi:hypothetical protein
MRGTPAQIMSHAVVMLVYSGVSRLSDPSVLLQDEGYA